MNILRLSRAQKIGAAIAAIAAFAASAVAVMGYFDQKEKDRIEIEAQILSATRDALSALGFEGNNGRMEVISKRSGTDEFFTLPDIDEEGALVAIAKLEILTAEDDVRVLTLRLYHNILAGNISEANKYFLRLEENLEELTEADKAVAYSMFLYVKFGLKEEAEELLDDMLALTSVTSKHVHAYAQFLHSSNHRDLSSSKHQKAITLLREAIENEPYVANLQIGLAHILSETGRNDEAVEILKTVIAALPDYTAAHNLLGCIEWQRGHYSLAQASFESALSIEPTNSYYLYNLAVTLERLGQESQSERRMRQAIQYSTDQFSIDEMNGQPAAFF